MGRALTERSNFQAIAAESLLSVLAADLLLGTAAGALLALYARRRLGQINAIADEVLEGNLSVRIAVGEGGDEYDHLAQNINAMLDRIQRLVATVRGVSENIAHDLRTPLNRLRGRLEVALMAPRSPEEYEAVLKRAIAESDTIVDTFNGILKIARIKAGALSLPHAPVNLAEVVEELADLYEAFAEESGVAIEAKPCPAGRGLRPGRCASHLAGGGEPSRQRHQIFAEGRAGRDFGGRRPRRRKPYRRGQRPGNSRRQANCHPGPFRQARFNRRQTGLRAWPELRGRGCGVACGAP